MKKTGIFLDLDGTLINSNKKISNLDKKIIKELNKTCNVYLITGKSFINAYSYYKKLNLSTKFITSMGQVISSPKDKAFKQIVKSTNVKYLFQLFNDLKQELIIKNFLLETIDGKYIVKNKESSNMINLIVHNKKNMTSYDKSYKESVVGAYIEIEKELENILLKNIKKLNKKYEKVFSIAYWLTGDNLPIIQIKPINTGKSQAILRIKKIDSIEKIISFGNGWNDRHMLSGSDIGYAMKNSHESVKNFADKITEFDNNNSGVGKELIKLFNLNI